MGFVRALPWGWSTVFDRRWLGAFPGNSIVQLASRWHINDICADQMRPLDHDPLALASTWTRPG